MQIAIVGTGSIGSTFAYHLAQSGHDVTVIARGTRLSQLQADNAIVTVSGDRAPVKVSAAIDAVTPFDLVLVTVLATQVDTVLPALQASAARTVMFMFNTFESLGRLREAVGGARFAFGFPAILATLTDGKLKSKVYTRGQVTTVTDAAWAKVFTDAGILSVVHGDMESYLRSHTAFVVPLMAIACLVYGRGKGISWAEAKGYSRAMAEGFGVVRQLGNRVTPFAAVAVSRMPGALLTMLLWGLSRMAMTRELGVLGPGEARSLIDGMTVAAPGRTAALLAIRP